MKAIEVFSDRSRKYLGCCAPLAAKKAGVALWAGLEAALKPRERVFPLTGCHP